MASRHVIRGTSVTSSPVTAAVAALTAAVMATQHVILGVKLISASSWVNSNWRSAQVLVAEAAGDLVVAVDAADHAELLEQLRALRRAEVAGLLATAPRSRGSLGVDAMSIGVSTSTKPWSSIAARMARLTAARVRRLRCMSSRRRST